MKQVVTFVAASFFAEPPRRRATAPHPDKTLFATAGTDTLAGLAADAMNKVIAAQLSHLQFWPWYERITVPVPNDGSVHDMKLITLGDLPPVSEGAA